MPITQTNRLVAIDTPLGQDKVILTRVAGTGAVSALFDYKLEMFATDEDPIDPTQLLGKAVTVSIKLRDEDTHYINGYINKFYQIEKKLRGGRNYQAEMVPWLWFLTQTQNCRIFQNKSATQIIEQIFQDAGFRDYKLAVQNAVATRDYCVQYNETAFAFVTRLMAEEGLYYYFTHTQQQHTLVIADQPSSYVATTEQNIEYTSGTIIRKGLSYWEKGTHFFSGTMTTTDYNFETPATALLNTVQTILPFKPTVPYETFHYPGNFTKTTEGKTIVKHWIESTEATYQVMTGRGNYASFMPATKFTLSQYEHEADNTSYVITSITHEAQDHSHLAGETEPIYYRNLFTCIPSDQIPRPLGIAVKPIVPGPQTAVVVGPSGEEIFTDKYGRIKVQFFWDRLGNNDEKSSCWIRVAQGWAGNSWGQQFIPRIGQEVIVHFMNGDPDQPIVVGSFYNAAQMPPYSLPDNMTQSGIKSHSTKNGQASDANELRFEDKKDAEEVYLHAQKDANIVVENDETVDIKHDQTITVKNDRTVTISEGNDSLTVSKGNHTVKVSQGNQTVDVDQGKHTMTVAMGDHSLNIKRGNQSTELGMGNATLTIKMGNQTTKLNLGKSSLEAMQSIELTVGQNSLKIDQTGVSIQGLMVKIKGTLTQVNADAMLQLKGGITMIN